MKDSKKTISITKVKDNTNIVQANILLENRPRFTKDETRLFLTILGTINKDDDDFAIIEIPVTEFAELWQIDSSHAYEKIKAALRGLRSKEFFLEGTNPETGKKRFLSMSYLSSVSYEEGEGYAKVRIDPDFRPYLLDLKKNYTKYMMENVLSLSSVNAIRNYELLKQYENLGERIFEFDDYKKKLGLEDKYERFRDLRRYVIEPSIEEINQFTDIDVSFEIKGRGKKAKIVFDIKSKKQKKKIEDVKYDVAAEPEEVLDKDVEFFREPFSRINPNWSITDDQVLHIASMIKDSLPYEVTLTPESFDLAAYDKLDDILKHAKAEGARSIYGWLEFMFKNTDLLERY